MPPAIVLIPEPVVKPDQVPVVPLVLTVHALQVKLHGTDNHIFRRAFNRAPRLTTAHHYKYKSLPAYHFLCDMQLQDQQVNIFFNWGELENEIPFRPRVRYKNTMLKEAGWTIEEFLFDEEHALVKENENTYLNE